MPRLELSVEVRIRCETFVHETNKIVAISDDVFPREICKNVTGVIKLYEKVPFRDEIDLALLPLVLT